MKELLLFRSYITGSVSRDFNLRYRGSVLGAALVFLAPAFQIALYVLVFGNLLQGRLPGNASFYGYSVYLCAGILFWNLFFEIIQRSQNLYLENANLIKKAAFPLSALSVVNVVSCSINLGLSLLLFGLFLALSLAWPGWGLWGLVPVWLAVAAVAVALGQCLAILQVFFRDFTVLTPIALQTCFWATPIVYPPEILPAWFMQWLPFNPLYAPVATAQALALNTPVPALSSWLSTLVTLILALGLAHHLHRKLRPDLLDNL
jgi:lipopolysaccharide transport system permease protein